MIFGFCWEGGGGGYHLGNERCEGGSFLTVLWLPFASYLQPEGYLRS